MSLSPRRAARCTAHLVAAAVVVLLVCAAPAGAHSELERSDPPNGGMVAPGRAFLTLWFGEPINAEASSFDLHTADGTPVEVVASTESDGGGVVRLDSAPLDRATYQLDWRVLSLADGHPSSGSVLFGAGSRPDMLPSEAGDLPGAPLLVLRWLDLSAILLAIGVLAVSGRVLGALGPAGARARRRARHLGVLAAAVAVYAGMITPLVRTQRPGNPLSVWLSETWVTLVATPWGHVWLVREAAVLVAAGAIVVWARRTEPAAGAVRLAFFGLATAAWLEAWAGHASALPGGSAAVAVASAAHVLAAGVWAGGLLVLTLTLLPMMRRNPDVRGPVLSSVWRAYSPMAALASVVLLATGLFQAGRHLPDLGSVGSTVYSGAVAAKTILLVLALLLAGLNTMLVNPAVAARVVRLLGQPVGWSPVSLARFSVVVAAEAAVLVAAVGAAALVTSVPTAREVASATRTTAPYSENVDGLFVTFEEVPGGADRSRLVVRTRSTVLPAPAPVRGVTVVLTGPDGSTGAVRLDLVEDGRYEADTAAPEPGGWSATVAVQRAGLPDAVSRAEWTEVGDGAATGPLQDITAALAAGLLGGLLVVLVVVRRRRPSAVPSLTPPVGPVDDRDRSLR